MTRVGTETDCPSLGNKI